MEQEHFTTVVIGSGFGGTLSALAVADEYARRNRGESVLVLERGTWWTTPVGTVQNKEVKTFDLLTERGQPVQYWSSVNHFKGALDLFLRCMRRGRNPDGLLEFTRLGSKGFFGLFRRENDGVSILAANGVGGGSLVYSNITVRPPELILSMAILRRRWAELRKTCEIRQEPWLTAGTRVGRRNRSYKVGTTIMFSAVALSRPNMMTMEHHHIHRQRLLSAVVEVIK